MRIFLTFVILILFEVFVYSQYSSCYRFKLEINLDNDEIISGYYFYYGMYLDLPDTSSFKEILSRIKYFNDNTKQNEKLIIYKNIGILNHPKCDGSNIYYCLKENVVNLSITQVKNYKVIEKVGCHSDESDYIKRWYGYKYVGGCSPEVITELNINEINMLANKPKLEFRTSYEYEKYFGEECQVHILSYSKIDSISIMNIVDGTIKNDNLSNNQETYVTDLQYQKLKSILRKKKIIMFRTYYYD
ncbi:MAG: hypothetical protein NTW49_03500 [Bacteroidia bacterium]|nr:hypothetical protein [Bacteroidia bacterium]